MVPHLHKPPQNKKKNLEKTLGTDISPNPSPSRNMNTKENQRSINDNHTFVGKVVCLLRCRRLWDNLAARGWPGVRPDGSPGLRGRFVLGGVTASRFCFLSCVYSSFLPSFYLSLVSVSVVCMDKRWFMCATTRVNVMGHFVELILSTNPGDLTQAVGLSGQAPSHVAVFLGLQLYYPNSHLLVSRPEREGKQFKSHKVLCSA